MADDQSEKLNRREFLGTGLVTSIGAVLPPEPQKPPAGSFVSRAGNQIPFARRELFATGARRGFEGRRSRPAASGSRSKSATAPWRSVNFASGR